jgi:hypothetical protein
MMLDALAAFVSLTIPTPGERKGGAAQGASALLPSPALRERGRG